MSWTKDIDKMVDDAAKVMTQSISGSIEKALVLRVRVHCGLALRNGAEMEDMGTVIGDALTSASEEIYNTIRRVSEMDRADEIKIQGTKK